MVRAIAFGFQNLLTLEGRDRRRVFWSYWLAVALVWAATLFLVIGPALEKTSTANVGFLALIAIDFLMFFFLFSACVRRLHDSDVSERPAVIVFGAWVITGIVMIPISQWHEFGLASAGSNWLDIALMVLLAPAAFVATFGTYWMLYLLLRKGTAGPNRYGPQPPKSIKEAKSAQ